MRQRVIGTWGCPVALLSLWVSPRAAWSRPALLCSTSRARCKTMTPYNIRNDGEPTFIDLLNSVEGTHLGAAFWGQSPRHATGDSYPRGNL